MPMDYDQINKTLSQTNDLKQVESLLEQAPAPVYRQLANDLWQQQRLHEALHIIDLGIARFPKRPRFHRLRSEILAALGQTRNAALAALTVVELAPNVIPHRLHAARLLIADLQPQHASEHINAALQLEPNLHQIKRMNNMLKRIEQMSTNARRRPLRWLLRRFNHRITNVDAES